MPMFHSSNYAWLQPRWKRITPQPGDSRARSSSEQRDHRSIELQTVCCKKTTHILTNHLGNVQATVLDRATPILNNDTLVTGYKADISLAHDYYPFGMLMPGRYVSDTGQKCVTINTTVLVPVVVKVYLDGVLATSYKYGDPNTPAVHNLPVAMLAADEQPYVYHYNDASTHPNGEVVSAQLVEGHSEFGISLSEEPSGGVTAYFMIHADTNQTEQEIGFDLTLPDDCFMRMRVRQYAGTGEEYDEAVSWTNVDMSGAQQLMVPMDKAAIAAGGKTVLELEFNSAMGGNFPANQNEPDVFARNFYYKITHYEPKTRIAIVCDEKDNYRFGFNGQEKDNEIAGIGNHTTAMFWEYDTRLGRRWNVDPLTYPWQSSYAAFNNNPIIFVDPLGLFGTRKEAREYKKSHDLSGRVRLNQDGSYSVDDKKAGTSTYRDDELGIQTATLITAKRPDAKELTPWKLGVEWLSGTGARSRAFEAGDNITEMYKSHEHVGRTRQMVINQLSQSSGINTADGSNPYSLSGIEGVGKYVKDYSTLATAGQTGNLIYTYLGSHSLQYTVNSVDIQARTAVVTFMVHNTSTMQSATRPPVIGYQEWYQNSVGKLTDKLFKNGAGSETEQWIEWTETVKW